MKSIALILLLCFCGTSSAEITKITVNKAWKRITKSGNLTSIPITYEKDNEPNAWVKFEGGKLSVHVTKGLMKVLSTEDEIAGVLGHELGHIQLGHHETESLPPAMSVIGINPSENLTAFDDGLFSLKQEYDADDYSINLLRKLRYSPRGLYDALTKIGSASHGFERNGITSSPVSSERLARIADKAGFSHDMKGSVLIGMEDVADIMLGR